MNGRTRESRCCIGYCDKTVPSEGITFNLHSTYTNEDVSTLATFRSQSEWYQSVGCGLFSEKIDKVLRMGWVVRKDIERGIVTK